MALIDTPVDSTTPVEAVKPLASLSHFVSCENVGLTFPRFSTDNLSFRRMLLAGLGRKRRRPPQAPALRGVTFEARPGDRIGLIGANGAGKSTLLRVLMGAYEPMEGRVVRRGTTASMINTTLGMDPYLSGYANIRLRARRMGLSNRHIREIVPEVEEFTELGDALNDPLKTYSSGMMARLSFAIATSLHAQIYLMDEWIGAGDARFFEKAKERMSRLIDDNAILFLASHSDDLIKQWCNRVLVINKGHVAMDTDPNVGILVKNRFLLGAGRSGDGSP